MTKETVKFEGIDNRHPGNSPIPDVYAGFHWQAIFALNTRDFADGDPYKLAAHSGQSIAYSDPSLGIDQKFSSDVSFTLKSMYLAAVTEPVDVKIIAFNGDNKVGHTTIHLDVGAEQFTFGGHFQDNTAEQIDAGDAQVAIDDITVNFDGDIPGVGPTHPAGDATDASLLGSDYPVHDLHAVVLAAAKPRAFSRTAA